MKTIKLLGIRDDKQYKSWHRKTSEVLQELNLQRKLEEVNDIDSIINFNASAIPALILNDTIIMEQIGHTPGIEEIRQAISKYLPHTK